MFNLITSQHYIDNEIVQQKIADSDFDVQVSPEFEVDGVAYRVILDGHHSFEAALSAGVTPEFFEQSASEDDRIGLLDQNEIAQFLEVCHMDGDYKFATSKDWVW